MDPTAPITIICKKKGSITIEGTIVVLDEDGRVIPLPEGKNPNKVKLCGCGRSESKPFCDGSHKK